MSHVTVELDLPDHTSELRDTIEYVNNLKKRLSNHKDQRLSAPMSVNEYEALYEDIIKGLYYTGYLSTPAFNVQDKLEETYFTRYKHSPQLAKKLFWDHYEDIHHPYTLIKNRLYRIITELNELYFRIHKRFPADYIE
ncbi:unnamed protein product [marine sediment metagenome]|uniref:Uncharacterized protein n=1 Tax=marine sediment metagenome TaxID=412755 RepID=X0SW95_9ZZZZ